jgi:excisionase family DNA binding protein
MILTRAFSRIGSSKYITSMTDNIPDLPGYISTKEAAKILGISERRVRLYIEMKRLRAVRAADVLLLPLDDVKNFKRKIVGRPRKNTLAWRISSTENTQFMTFISVQMRPQREKQLMQRLEEVKRGGQHVFPGTVARYVVRSKSNPRQIELLLIWRSTVMPNEVEREQALEAFRQTLADVLDWGTAQYNNGTVLIHT